MFLMEFYLVFIDKWFFLNIEFLFTSQTRTTALATAWTWIIHNLNKIFDFIQLNLQKHIAIFHDSNKIYIENFICQIRIDGRATSMANIQCDSSNAQFRMLTIGSFGREFFFTSFRLAAFWLLRHRYISHTQLVRL